MNKERSTNLNPARLSAYAALAAASTAMPATSQAAVVWSGDTGFVPVTVPVGSTAAISFPTFGAVFRFSNASFGPASSTGTVGPFANSAVVQRVLSSAVASVIQGSATNGVGGRAFGNDALRFAHSQSSNPIDGGEGGGPLPHWGLAPSNGTSLDLAGDSAGLWNGPGTETGYMLFRFDPDGPGATGFRYGWFDISYSSLTDDLTINGWAFADNGALLGAGHLETVDVPEASTLVPAGLFALAAGAAGIRRRRSVRRTALASAKN